MVRRLIARTFRHPFAPADRGRRARRGALLEGLETRVLFHLELVSELPDTAVAPGTTVSEINLSQHFDNEEIDGTIVRMNTDLGVVDIEMFDQGAPITVANFLGYVNRGDYNNTYFHRAVPDFIVQGGGYSVSTVSAPVHIPPQPPIQNEFSATRSNNRGTIAMAKVGGDPNSATSEFFFNLGNNSANLDSQNGGFTVFAKVINNTMSVVDAVAGLPLYDFPEVPFDELSENGGMPLQGTPPATADNVVKLQTAQVVPEAAVFSYTVQSSDPVLVTPVVENGVLRLNYGAGQTGTAEITVTATDAAGTTVSDTFTAGVGALDVVIGDGAPAKQVTFTDADGTAATISLKGGSGTLRFAGSNLSQNVTKGNATVLGNITDLGIELTGTGTSGALAVKAAGGDGLIAVNRLTSDGGMKSIAGKQVNVTGPVTIAGNVAKADFADVANSVMTFGGSGGSLALSLLNAEGVEIVSQIPIKSLKANQFSGGGPDIGTVSAPAIGSLTVNGDFNQRLDVAGTLGTVKIGGAVNSFLPWSVGGAAGKITVGSFAEGFIADFGGAVSALTVNGAFTGDVSAAALKSLTVKGDMTGANLILTGTGTTLGKATVSGAISTSRIQASGGSIGAVTAAAINGSTIYAGANTDGGILPSAGSDFVTPGASIKSVTVKGVGGAPSYANSNIAAPLLGRLSLGVVQAGNAGVPFGVAGDTIASVTGTGDAPVKLSRLTDPAQSTAQQQFEVRVL